MAKELIIKEQNWYQLLLADLRKLGFVGIVTTKWHIGKRILADDAKFGKPEHGNKRVENLARDIGMVSGQLWHCIKFAKKYPEFSLVERELKGLSWRHISQKLLYDPRPKPKMLPLPSGKYNIIYADPAWQYWEGGEKNQSQHYSTMKMADIQELPVQDLAPDNCILFLWATRPILPDAIDTLEKWGFKYSTIGFVWVKSKKDRTGFAFGNGNWTRANAEYCLIGTKGSVPRQDAAISEIIYEPRGEHSEKPAIVRDKIVQLVGDLPRIELFARQKTEGWDVWGNEI